MQACVSGQNAIFSEIDGIALQQQQHLAPSTLAELVATSALVH